MMQNIISDWADKVIVDDALKNDYLRRLAHEFCSKFNTKISNQKGRNDTLAVQTNEGLDAGYICVRSGYVRGSRETIYIYGANHILKERSSVNGNSEERESTKIINLLKSIAKNHEEPTGENIQRPLIRGISSAFGGLDGSHHKPDVHVPNLLGYQLIERYLKKVDGPLEHDAHNKAVDIYDQVQKQLRKFERQNAIATRFYKGCTAVGVSAEYTYLVGKVKYDKSADLSVIVTSPFTKHRSLRDIPELSGLTVIFSEYFKGYKNGELYDSKNEMGYRPHDMFHRSIDVAVGYAGHRAAQIYWMLIPDEPPVTV